MYRGHAIKTLPVCDRLCLYEVRLPLGGSFVPLKRFRFIPGNKRSQFRALAKAKRFVDGRVHRRLLDIQAQRAQIRVWMLHPQ
jgi:hypothetical protein